MPVSQLQPGDLLFYHTDPTAPGYISHVAIYLGNGWMIQAPQPGMDVEVGARRLRRRVRRRDPGQPGRRPPPSPPASRSRYRFPVK